MFNNLRELIVKMPDEKSCRDYLIQQRWNGRVKCPYCECEKCYVIEGGKRFKCSSKTCYQKFSVTVGTFMEDSKIPLTKWLMAIYLITAHKKGISSYQLGKDIGVSQTSSWFMLHRIREMMRQKLRTPMKGTVEIDETYIGGKMKNKHRKTRAEYIAEGKSSVHNKTGVMGFLERGNDVRLEVMSEKMPLKKRVVINVKDDALVITDSHAGYVGLDRTYLQHEVVNHFNDEFVRGEFHTNSVEGLFSHLKRSIYGIYHQVTPKHLSRYCDETAYRYNSRKLKDNERFAMALQNIEGTLPYKKLIAAKEPVKDNEPPKSRGKKVVQIKDGEIVATWNSPKEAAILTGIKQKYITNATKTKKRVEGYYWSYIEQDYLVS